MFERRSWLLCAALWLLPGCSVLSPFSSVTKLDLQLTANEQLNHDLNGRPSPIVLRLFELRHPVAFENADFFSLYDRARESLPQDLIATRELELRPGKTWPSSSHRPGQPPRGAVGGLPRSAPHTLASCPELARRPAQRDPTGAGSHRPSSNFRITRPDGTATMNRDKVIWQEGMLLRPQHLQHNDRYYDHQLKARTRLLGRHFWGFTQVEIDPQFLQIGQIVLNRAAGVLPDGSLFDREGSRQPLMLEVPANSGPMLIYLALPLVTGNHIEARPANQEEVLARYCSYEVEVMDSNAGAQTRSSILCAQPNLQLLAGESGNDQAWVKLPLCQVQGSNADGAISLDPEFMPTVLETQSSEFLSACLREVIALRPIEASAWPSGYVPMARSAGRRWASSSCCR